MKATRTTTAVLLLVLCLPLGACAAVEADATAAIDELAKAKTVVGIAEGIAGVAVLADPALAVIVNPIVAAINAAEASAADAAASATVDVATVNSQAAVMESQAVALENSTAQVVTVTPNSAPASRRADAPYRRSTVGLSK